MSPLALPRLRHVKIPRGKRENQSSGANPTHGAACRARPIDTTFDPSRHGQRGAAFRHADRPPAVRAASCGPDPASQDRSRRRHAPERGRSVARRGARLRRRRRDRGNHDAAHPVDPPRSEHHEVLVTPPEWQVPAIAPAIRPFRAFHNLLVLEKGEKTDRPNLSSRADDAPFLHAIATTEREVSRFPTAMEHARIASVHEMAGRLDSALETVQRTLVRWTRHISLLTAPATFSARSGDRGFPVALPRTRRSPRTGGRGAEAEARGSGGVGSRDECREPSEPGDPPGRPESGRLDDLPSSGKRVPRSPSITSCGVRRVPRGPSRAVAGGPPSHAGPA